MINFLFTSLEDIFTLFSSNPDKEKVTEKEEKKNE